MVDFRSRDTHRAHGGADEDEDDETSADGADGTPLDGESADSL